VCVCVHVIATVSLEHGVRVAAYCTFKQAAPASVLSADLGSHTATCELGSASLFSCEMYMLCYTLLLTIDRGGI
jgi:hypothetical protein